MTTVTEAKTKKSEEPVDHGEATFITDLIALQSEVPVIAFDTANNFKGYKYASLTAVMEQVRPLLRKHNFAWVTKPIALVDGGRLGLEYHLLHRGGYGVSGTMALHGGDNPQTQGSALTYARRYTLAAVLGLVADEDDDARIVTEKNSVEGGGSGSAGPAPTSAKPKEKASLPAPRPGSAPATAFNPNAGGSYEIGAACPICGEGVIKKGSGKKGTYAECSKRIWTDPSTCQFVDFRAKFPES